MVGFLRVGKLTAAMNRLAEELKRFNDHTDAWTARESGDADRQEVLDAVERLKRKE